MYGMTLDEATGQLYFTESNRILTVTVPTRNERLQVRLAPILRLSLQ